MGAGKINEVQEAIVLGILTFISFSMLSRNFFLHFIFFKSPAKK